MAPKKAQLVPKATTAAPLRPKASRITKPKATGTADGGVGRSSRLAGKAAVEPCQLYKNGLLNLERTPSHLVHVAKRNATDSPLLRMPPEIRNKIWEFAMGYQLVKAPGCLEEDHYWRHSKTGGAISRPTMHKVDWDKGVTPWALDVYPRRSTTKTPSAFHLPEVCRQIYSETATLGYSLNTFVVTSSHLNYNNWATDLLPAYRSAIQSIEPAPRYLLSLVVGRLTRPLRPRVFPGLTTIMVSDIAIDYLSWDHRHQSPGLTTNERKEAVKARIHEVHGQDLEVVFQQADNVSG